MTKLRSQLQILLLQAREDEITRLEELAAFARYGQLALKQFTVLDVFATPDFAPDCVDGYDALFVGGSSDASVLKPEIYGFVDDAKALMSYCVDRSVPVFASCFGFQIAVEALGGKVILDRAQMEMGVYPIRLTPAAHQDPLLQDLPEEFWAVSGHQERAVQLPENVLHLASSDRCPYHALMIPGKPFYGFQFHPEVDAQDLAARITRYRDRYLDSPDALQQILEQLRETPESNQLIAKFIDRVLTHSG
jgi:GMP synthase (glutamine-hydrolysing)